MLINKEEGTSSNVTRHYIGGGVGGGGQNGSFFRYALFG